MTIARVDVILLQHRLARPRVYAVASSLTRESVLVRLEDGDGTPGWGETYLKAGLLEAVEGLGRLLVGNDPDRPLEFWSRHAGLWPDRYARSAISIALDDLRARRRGIPISGLYGGALRHRVRAYASSGGYPAGADLAAGWIEECTALARQGFTAVKLRIGRYAPELEMPALDRVRGALPSLQLMADGNAGYTPAAAVRVSRVLGALGFSWFEEPLPHDDYAGYPRLREKLGIPLAGGELLQSATEARRRLRARAFDIIQPDPSICGGIADALRVAELAPLYGAACIPHTCNGAIALAATLQLLAIVPPLSRLVADEDLLLEYDSGENPLRTDLLSEPLVIGADGWLTVPCRPGLGIDVDAEFIANHALQTVVITGHGR